MTRCVCRTLKGDQCKKDAIAGKTMCGIHEKKCVSLDLSKKKIATKKVTAKKVSAKKVTAKKVAAKKPVKKVTIKKVAAKKPVKKVTVKKIPAKDVIFENVERILDYTLEEFPNREIYPSRDFEGKIVPENYDNSDKERLGFTRPLWWDYFPEAGSLANERLNSKWHKIEDAGAPQNRPYRTGRICIYNQFRDYTGPEALADILSDRLKSANIPHRIIGYEYDSFIINLFIKGTETDVINRAKKFMIINNVRMDEDWVKNNVSIGRLYGSS